LPLLRTGFGCEPRGIADYGTLAVVSSPDASRTIMVRVRVRVAVDEVQLYFDVEGCGLAALGDAMVQRPTLVLLHGGPGVDHRFFKPEFPAMVEAARVCRASREHDCLMPIRSMSCVAAGSSSKGTIAACSGF
jgi:hypothetical protein